MNFQTLLFLLTLGFVNASRIGLLRVEPKDGARKAVRQSHRHLGARPKNDAIFLTDTKISGRHGYVHSDAGRAAMELSFSFSMSMSMSMSMPNIPSSDDIETSEPASQAPSAATTLEPTTAPTADIPVLATLSPSFSPTAAPTGDDVSAAEGDGNAGSSPALSGGMTALVAVMAVAAVAVVGALVARKMYTTTRAASDDSNAPNDLEGGDNGDMVDVQL